MVLPWPEILINFISFAKLIKGQGKMENWKIKWGGQNKKGNRSDSKGTSSGKIEDFSRNFRLVISQELSCLCFCLLNNI